MATRSRLAATLLAMSTSFTGCASDTEDSAKVATASAAAAAERGEWWQTIATDSAGRDYSMLSTDRSPRPETTFDVWLLRGRHLDAEELRRRRYRLSDPGQGIRVRFDCRGGTMQVLAEGIPTPDGGFTVARNVNEAARTAAPRSFEAGLLIEACRATGREARPYD